MEIVYGTVVYLLVPDHVTGLQNHLDVYLADVDEVSGADIQRSASPKTHSIDEAPSSSRPGAKRKADASNLGTPHNVESAAHKLFALSAVSNRPPFVILRCCNWSHLFSLSRLCAKVLLPYRFRSIITANRQLHLL